MTLTARLALLVSLAACADRTLTSVPPQHSGEQRQEIPVSVGRDIDILFVVDNSDSMEQEQDSLARNFPEFIRVLQFLDGELPDLHVGVISSDVGTAPEVVGQCEGNGDDGILQVPAGCAPLEGGDRFIIDVLDPDTGERDVNYVTATLAQQFECMARLGIGGCGFEQHFEAVRRALDNRAENAGFLRDDAFLAVIFIQDEDDCSASDRGVFDPEDASLGQLSSFRCFEHGVRCKPDDPRAIGDRQDCEPRDDSIYIEEVQLYADALRGIKSDPGRVIVAAIAGAAGPVSVALDESKDPPELHTPPVCTVCPGGGSSGCPLDPELPGAALVSARPAVRLHALLDAFPQRSTFQDICAYDPAIDDVDLSGALVQIAALLKKALGSPCIEGDLADRDPDTGGVQPDCSVSDVIHLHGPDEREELLHACDGPLDCDGDLPDPPCYRFERREDCATETGLAIAIERCEPAADDTTLVVRCRLE